MPHKPSKGNSISDANFPTDPIGDGYYHLQSFEPRHEAGGVLVRMDMLVHVTDSINSASDAHTVARRIAEESARLCETDKATVYVFNDDGEVERVTNMGLPRGFAHDAERLGSAHWALNDFMSAGGPRVMPIVSGGPYPTPLHKLAASEGMEALVCSPMTYAEGTVGLVILYLETAREIDEECMETVRVLANAGALAIAHLRLAETRKWERAAQDQFLDVLSHELRTPLTSIMGFTQVIRRRFLATRDGDPRLREQLDLLWAQTQRLHRLLDAFVDVSNIERGEFTIEREQVDVVSALNHGVAQAKAQSHTRHTIDVQGPDHPLWLLGDLRRLEHVFIHLVSNAIRYSPVEQPIQVTCAERPGREVVVSVGDHGPGIPSNVQREIFKRFYPSDTRKAGGMGMGLYFSRAIVEAHGGKLSIHSTPGAGTTVSISLPL